MMIVAQLMGNVDIDAVMSHASCASAAFPLRSSSRVTLRRISLTRTSCMTSPCQRRSANATRSSRRAGMIPAVKYAALSRWAAKFTAENGRAPLIWLDRACIDQSTLGDPTALKQNPSCLPVCVGGCSGLCASGPTYLHRQWCMVEVLAFYLMNKGINQITLIPLDPTDVLSEVSTVRPPSAPQDASPPVASVEPSSSSGMTQPPLSPAEPLAALEERVAVLERGHREMVAANEALHQRMRATEDLRLALDRFRAFDVNEANCYLECDRQRLLGIADAAYGSLDEFNPP